MVDVPLLREFIRGLPEDWAYPKVSFGERTSVVRLYFVERIGFL